MKKVIIVLFIVFFSITSVDALTFSDYLIEKANDKNVKEYTSGDKTQMYTFDHPETVQTPTLTDYRYIGKKPNNYVYFNCENEDDKKTCEVWRIIGVFEVEDGKGNKEKRVKIMRNDLLPQSYQWDSDKINEYGNDTGFNEWTTSNVNKVLNEEFYGKLSDSSQKMIGSTMYYLGGAQVAEQSGAEYYRTERGKEVYNGHSINWVGKVGLMYASDYIYTFSLGIDSDCYENSYNCYFSDTSNSWIYDSNNVIYLETLKLPQWTMTPLSNFSFLAFTVGSSGQIEPDWLTSYYAGVRPVVYLRSDIYIEDGDGSLDNPFQLTLNNPDEKKEENDKPITNPSTGINNPYTLAFVVCGVSIISIIIARKKKYI